MMYGGKYVNGRSEVWTAESLDEYIARTGKEPDPNQEVRHKYKPQTGRDTCQLRNNR